jgi:hypothetical protein
MSFIPTPTETSEEIPLLSWSTIEIEDVLSCEDKSKQRIKGRCSSIHRSEWLDSIPTRSGADLSMLFRCSSKAMENLSMWEWSFKAEYKVMLAAMGS